MSPLVVVVAALATYSLTLLVVCDKITDRPRQRLLTAISGHGYGGRLLGLVPATDDPAGVLAYTCACAVPGDAAGRGVFLTLDDLLEHIHEARQAIAERVPMSKPGALLYLLSCPWCASLYVAAPVAWSAWCFGDRAWWFVPALALASRGFTGAAATYANPRS